jgi:carbon storage regulator
MLVLSRKLDESIRIGDEISVKVLGVSGQQVRLGIEAPREVQIDRAELRLDLPEDEPVAVEQD